MSNTIPEPAFRLTYRDGAYRVSKPNIDDCDCYTAEQMRAVTDVNGQMLEALQRLMAVYSASYSGEVRLNAWEQARAAIAKATQP